MTKREKEAALVPLTDAEAAAMQSVSEVEGLKQELEAMRDLWAHVCWRLGVPDGTDKQGALDGAIDALKPAEPVFTAAQVREALGRRRAQAHADLRAEGYNATDYGNAAGREDACDGIASDLGISLD